MRNVPVAFIRFETEAGSFSTHAVAFNDFVDLRKAEAYAKARAKVMKHAFVYLDSVEVVKVPMGNAHQLCKNYAKNEIRAV